jgi:hypothetical protein
MDNLESLLAKLEKECQYTQFLIDTAYKHDIKLNMETMEKITNVVQRSASVLEKLNTNVRKEMLGFRKAKK